MTEPDERGERGLGDPFRAMWLEGSDRPPFCSSGRGHSRLTPDLGCRYCWPNQCQWDKAQEARGVELNAHRDTYQGRHRTPARVGGFRALFHLHRVAKQAPSEDEMGGEPGA